MFLFKGNSVLFANENTVDPRDAAIDRAIGGMVEGSRPLAPQNYAGKNQIHKVPGANLSPGMDAKVTATGTGNADSNLGGSTNVGIETGGVNQEAPIDGSASESVNGGSTSDSIVSVDANVDLSGGTPAVDANLAVDTDADTLLDANTSTTTDVISTDTTVTESGTVAGEDLTMTINEAPIDAILDSEIVATDVPADSEATAGLEADVDPVTADSDVTPTDPADGLGL